MLWEVLLLELVGALQRVQNRLGLQQIPLSQLGTSQVEQLAVALGQVQPFLAVGFALLLHPRIIISLPHTPRILKHHMGRIFISRGREKDRTMGERFIGF